MLFPTFEFLFVYFPLVLGLYLLFLKYISAGASQVFLIAASLIFYSIWNPVYVLLIMGSMVVNYSLSIYLQKSRSRSLFIGTLAFNLGLLAYYKYANFFIENINFFIEGQIQIGNIVLPLAISFFTFQQIAYICDIYNKKCETPSFANYLLFIAFFPQLIAGPIVHHSEMMPQFNKTKSTKGFTTHISIGLSLLSLGLFKKLVIADRLANYANPVFAATEVEWLEAWIGTLSYTLQLYFDFSGYSDIAIGVARCFGIILPLNFNSPYRSRNISEFWRRWHMTLSRFLRDYLYIPLGGNRKGVTRRYINLFLTMLLGGLWHGAGWVFVFWGMLHGLYLIIHQLFVSLAPKAFLEKVNQRLLFQMLTFLFVHIAWVFFRAENFTSATALLKTMFSFDSIVLPIGLSSSLSFLENYGFSFAALSLYPGVKACLLIVLCLFVTWFFPNSQEIIPQSQNGEPRKWYQLKPTPVYAVICSVLLFVCILDLNKVSEFLYFQF